MVSNESNFECDHKPTITIGSQIGRYCRANDPARCATISENWNSRSATLGTRTMWRKITKSYTVHWALQQNVVLVSLIINHIVHEWKCRANLIYFHLIFQGTIANPQARRQQGSWEACDKIHKNYETSSENQQLQFVFGVAVGTWFGAHSTVNFQSLFYFICSGSALENLLMDFLFISFKFGRLEWHKTITEGLKEYCALIDSSSSFRAYRQALAETNPPCIPYM